MGRHLLVAAGLGGLLLGVLGGLYRPRDEGAGARPGVSASVPAAPDEHLDVSLGAPYRASVEVPRDTDVSPLREAVRGGVGAHGQQSMAA